MPAILAIAEQRDGSLRAVSREMISAARSIANTLDAEVHAALIGPPGSDAHAAALGKAGAATVHIASHDNFARYSPDGFAATLAGHIRELHAEGRTVVLIEHNLTVVMTLCQRLVVLDHGQKIAEGPPSVVRETPAVIDAYFGS